MVLETCTHNKRLWLDVNTESKLLFRAVLRLEIINPIF